MLFLSFFYIKTSVLYIKNFPLSLYLLRLCDCINYWKMYIKYLVICAFEDFPSIPSFLATDCLHWIWAFKKKWLIFLLPFHSCATRFLFFFFIIAANNSVLLSYAKLVPTKYQWNISFPKKIASEICCQKY